MISVGGIGSGLDVDGLVQQLVSAERTPLARRYAVREANTQAQISALGNVQGALSGVETALEALADSDTFDARTAKSGNTDLLTASASGDAAAGTYSVKVMQLAQSQRLASGTFVDGDAEVGTGTLTIAVAGESVDLTIDATNNTLAGIRDAINNSQTSTGVRAAIINEDSGSRLVLTSDETGTANEINVTASGGDGGLDALVYDPGTLENLTVEQAAADSIIEIEGFTHTSSGNTVTGAVDGLTLDLREADTASTVTVTVDLDRGAMTQAFTKFAKAYNTAAGVIGNVTAYDAETGRSATLQGDAMMRSLDGQLRDLIYADYSATNDRFSSLAEIGFEFNASGELTINSTTLDAALEGGINDVVSMVTGTDGFSEASGTLLDAYLGSSGQFEQRTEILDSRIDGIGSDRERLDARMESVEARLRRQFTALDQLVSQMTQTSTFLAQQLASLPSSSLNG